MLNRNGEVRFSFHLSPDVAGDDLVRVDTARSEFAHTFSLITSHVNAGRKIEAIKLYRGATGAGLLESKNAIEALAPTVRAAAPVTPTLPGNEPDYRIVLEDNSDSWGMEKTFMFRINEGVTEAEALEEAERRCANSREDETVYLVRVVAKSKRTLSMVKA